MKCEQGNVNLQTFHRCDNLKLCHFYSMEIYTNGNYSQKTGHDVEHVNKIKHYRF